MLKESERIEDVHCDDVGTVQRFDRAAFSLEETNADSRGRKHFPVVSPVADGEDLVSIETLDEIQFTVCLPGTRNDDELHRQAGELLHGKAKRIGCDNVYMYRAGQRMDGFCDTGEQPAIHGEGPVVIGDQVLKAEVAKARNIDGDHGLSMPSQIDNQVAIIANPTQVRPARRCRSRRTFETTNCPVKHPQ